MLNVEVKKLDNSEVEIAGEIAAVDFESFRREVMDEFRQEAELPGFRKGHAPDSLIIEKVGAEKILYEMAEHALAHYYPEILKEQKIDAIGRPEIAITKIASDNPLGFKIKTAVMPEIKLADFKKISKKENGKKAEPIEATDKEIDEVVDEIRKNRAHELAHPAGEPHEHSDDEKLELPEMNDEFAKSLGQFESVADLRQKIKENLGHEKERRAAEKKRLEIMEEIINGSAIELPPVLVENELSKMALEMRGNLESMGLKYEDYLAHIKKTEDDVRKDWRPEAEKRVKFGLILEEIAKKENISADPQELEHEIDHIMSHYQDADPLRVRSYAESMLRNEAVFKFLEGLK